MSVDQIIQPTLSLSLSLSLSLLSPLLSLPPLSRSLPLPNLFCLSLPIFFAAAFAPPIPRPSLLATISAATEKKYSTDRTTDLSLAGAGDDSGVEFYKLGIPRRLADLCRFSSSAPSSIGPRFLHRQKDVRKHGNPSTVHGPALSQRHGLRD